MMEMLNALVTCAKIGAGLAVMLMSCGTVLVIMATMLGGAGALAGKLRHAKKRKAVKRGMEAMRKARENESGLRVLKDE